MSAASSITATPIASAGPSVVKKPSAASTSAPNAAITAKAADAIASPTRSTAATIASPGVVAGAQPLPVPEEQEEDVVGADAEQHDGEHGRQLLADLEVRAPSPTAATAEVETPEDQADRQQRQQRGDRATEDQQQQHDDQHDRRDR